MRIPKLTALVALSMLPASTGAVAQLAPAPVAMEWPPLKTDGSRELRGRTRWILTAVGASRTSQKQRTTRNWRAGWHPGNFGEV